MEVLKPADRTQPLRIGTAGWSIPSRYAEAVPQGGTHLQRYARVLNAAEINSSFHRPHQQKTYARWAASVPDGFRFSVKLPKLITHTKHFIDCDAELIRFADEVSGLGAKLAIVLVQLPPKSELDRAAVGPFFALLRQRIGARIVVEPRHTSWFAPGVGDWMAAQQIARVAADPAKIDGAEEPGGAADLVYFRWHGAPRVYYSDYDLETLKQLKRRLLAHRAAGAEVWCVFDNTAHGHALGNALAIATD